MRPTPFHARLALMGFLAIGGAIVLNVLVLQDRSVASAAERAKLERAQQRAQSERNRRLALDAREAQPIPTAAAVRTINAPPATAPLPPTRVGRFAVSAPKPDRAAPPVPPPDSEPDRSLDTIRQVQQQLGGLGYEPGPANGVPGLVTRGAVMAYEHDNGLPLTGEPSEALLRHLLGAPGAEEAAQRLARQQRAGHAEQVIRTVQQSLAALGYFAGKVDGRPGEETERSIREYEMDSGLVPTGRVSAPLLRRLARSASGARSASAPRPAGR